MLSELLMRRASTLIRAALGGYGIFCVTYSFTSPELAGKALILLGAALALSYFSDSSL